MKKLISLWFTLFVFSTGIQAIAASLTIELSKLFPIIEENNIVAVLVFVCAVIFVVELIMHDIKKYLKLE